LETWTRLTRWPGGGMVFNWLVGWQVPYAGSIGADIVELKYGQAVVGLEDRRKVRNHLSSVHAVALVNLGELTANLALMSMQPTSGRWIVTGVEAEYLKKACGRLTARCQVAPQDWSHNHEEEGQVSIVDSAQNEVTRLRVRWKLGPKRPRH
ncbi:MAG: DUF4442 domain-containing protein, partial [Myxococcota bacterium]